MYARALGRYVCSTKSVSAMALTAHMTVNSNQYVEANAPGASAFSPFRLMSRSGFVESDSSGQSSTHREEELHEGDIRGSFAEGA